MNTATLTPIPGPRPASAWLLRLAKDGSLGPFAQALDEAGPGPSDDQAVQA